MSYAFDPVRQLDIGEDVSGISRGVFAFAIQSLSCEDIAHPRVTLRLHSDVEDDHETVVEEEWVSMKCIKRGQFFKVGDLTEDETDLFLFRGGMLRFLDYHTHLEIEVRYKILGPWGYVVKTWSSEFKITEVLEFATTEEPVKLTLAKKDKVIKSYKNILATKLRSMLKVSDATNEEIQEAADNTVQNTDIEVLFQAFV